MVRLLCDIKPTPLMGFSTTELVRETSLDAHKVWGSFLRLLQAQAMSEWQKAVSSHVDLA